MSILAAVAVPHPPLIIPQIGKGKENKIVKTIESYHKAMKFLASFNPDTVVIATPHMEAYADYIHVSPGEKASGSFESFLAPEVSIDTQYDDSFVKALCEFFKRNELSAGTEGQRFLELDHASMIPLYFLRQYLKDFKTVRIGISGLDISQHYMAGQGIAQVADKQNKKVVFIASGDLSHRLLDDGPYGFNKNGPVFDEMIVSSFKTGDFESLLNIPSTVCEDAGECGFKPFVILAGALDSLSIESNLLSYEGPFGVGYGVATIKVKGPDQNNRYLKKYLNHQENIIKEKSRFSDLYTKLARDSIEYFVKNHEIMKQPKDLEHELLDKKAAVFVSIKKFGQLRGCIGSLQPTTSSVADEIIKFAVSACSQDPRFTPVLKSELPYLSVSVDVLTKPEKITSTSELNPKKYGVIVSCGFRRGVLLPDLEGVDSVEDQIRICRKKGNIREDESVELERFEVIRHF